MPTTDLIQQLNRSSSGAILLVLVEIYEETLAEPIRLVNGPYDYEHNEQTYHASWFKMPLPSQKQGELAKVTFEVENASRTLVTAARSIVGVATFTLTVVSYDEPGVVQKGPYEMKLREIRYDAQRMTGTLAYEDLLTQAFPYYRFVPSIFPGAF